MYENKTNNVYEERVNLTRIPKIESIKKLELQKYKKLAILLTTGSYCPVHIGHIKYLIEAKKFLEEKFDYKILRIYISPTHDKYVKGKSIRNNFQKYFIDFHNRCFLIEKTIENLKEYDENEIIFVDRWEGSQKGFIDFDEVHQKTKEFFNYKFPEIPIEVVIKI